MNSAWLKGIKKGSQEAKEVEEAFASSAFIRRRVVTMLTNMYEEETRRRISESEYESPSWAYKQADAVGYARAIAKVISLLENK